MLACQASLTQSCQSESFCRGQPRVGLVFSQDFKSGLSDHCGVNDGFGFRLLKNCMALKVMLAALQTAASTVRITCVPARFGINLYPPLSRWSQNFLMRLCGARPTGATHSGCHRAHITVPRRVPMSNKPLDMCSLKVTRPIGKHFAANGIK